MIGAEDLQCLKAIAMLGGHRGSVWISSQTLGQSLGVSPQTASRRLKSLEAQALVSRTLRPDGQYVTVTEKGEKELMQEHADYSRLFSQGKGEYSLAGTVVSGLGEGRYYMSLPEYRRQFLDLLGFEPYPGTLNVKLAPASMQAKKKIDTLEWITIRGFTSDNRTFGDARALPCRIGEIQCAIIVPGRSHYPDDILEIIAPIALRRTLSLDDGSYVTVEVAYD